MPGIAEAYFRINKFEKGEALFRKLLDITDRHLAYYSTFKRKDQNRIMDEITYQIRVLGNIMQISRQYNQFDIATEAEQLYEEYNTRFTVFR